MLVFLDESGDAGMKLDKGSSPFFLVALTTFECHDEAAACDAAIAGLRTKLSLPQRFEFHYVDNSKRQQQEFLATVAPFEFRTHIFALNKKKLSGPGFQYKDSLYKFAAGKTFENAKQYLEDATIVIDGCGDRTFRKQFKSYLKSRINSKESKHLGEIKIQPSHQNNLLQLADYVASISGAYLNGRKVGVAQRKQFLAPHEESFRLWPL